MKNNVINLTNIFLKDLINNLKLIKKNKKITKSNFFWLIVIISIAVAFFSYKIIDFFNEIGQPRIFLTFYFVIFTIVLLMQIIITVMNVLFFSKNLEHILPLPVTPTEILLAKYFVIVGMAYITELLFTLIPMLIYGLLTHVSLLYFLIMPVVLLIFPIFFITILSTLTILFMKLFKIIKNKNIYQSIIVTLLVYIVLSIEMFSLSAFSEQIVQMEISEEMTQTQIEEQYEEMYSGITKGYLVINPTIEILVNPNNLTKIIINLSKLFAYNGVALIIFLIIGKKIYLKNILMSTSITSGKIKKHKKSKIKIKTKNIGVAYIQEEIKQLFRNMTFFMQLILPITIIFIAVAIAGKTIIPVVIQMLQSDEMVKKAIADIPFDTTVVSIILCIIQILYCIPSISLTAISRTGKNANFMKYAPIDLHKQFLYKNTIQIFINLIIAIVVLAVVFVALPNITIEQVLMLFAITMFTNLISSFLMVVVDLGNPVLNWDSEHEITKNNPNKIFQYAFMIFMILIYLYFAKILKEININFALIIQLIIFVFVFFIINFLIKKNIKKLFKKII